LYSDSYSAREEEFNNVKYTQLVLPRVVDYSSSTRVVKLLD